MALSVPFTVPALEGVNMMDPEALCPAFKVRGSDTPLIEKTEAFIDNWVTVTLDPPLFDMEIVNVLLLPTFTLPKLRLDAENWKLAGGGGLVVVADAPPPHPVIRNTIETRANKTMPWTIACTFKTHLRATSFELAAAASCKSPERWVRACVRIFAANQQLSCSSTLKLECDNRVVRPASSAGT